MLNIGRLENEEPCNLNQKTVLGKLSDSGNTLEWIGDGIEEPTEWDTSKTRYVYYDIRYRRE